MSHSRQTRLRRWTWLPMLAVGLLVAACGKSGSSSSSADAYPGYQQVGQSGEAAQLWFNPTDIQRVEGGYGIHTLKTLPDGYARFDVLTNCRDTIHRSPGTQYRRDGTAERDYPGNERDVAARSEAGMGELITVACAAALASRAIHGDFNMTAALELLYGPYDVSKNAAKWPDAVIPKDLPAAENLGLGENNAPFYVRGLRVFDFTEGGKAKKLLVTNAAREDGTCHACTGLLGVTTFVQEGADWKIESSEPYVASMGQSGVVGSRMDWVTAGDEGFALVVQGEDMHQGEQTAYVQAFARDAAKKLRPILTDSDTGATDQESVGLDVAFLRGKDPHHYDAKLSFTYAMPGQKSQVANHVYEYVSGKYVLTRKDDPPKFTPPAGAAPIFAPVQAPSAAAPAAAPDPAATPATVSPQVSGACAGTQACLTQMLEAARTENLPAAMAAAGALSAQPRLARGDRTSARKLNTEGLAALKSENAAQAVKLLTAAAVADPGDEEVQSNLAYAYSLAGDLTQSVATAQRVLSMSPRRTSAWAPLAVTYAKMHQSNRALEAMWLAYQFSADKQKTVEFMTTRQQVERDPEVLKLYGDSLAWVTQNKKPASL